VEAPKAPVEYEAIGYLVRRFKSVLIAQEKADIGTESLADFTINALDTCAAELRLPSEEHSTYRFHKDMFISGIE